MGVLIKGLTLPAHCDVCIFSVDGCCIINRELEPDGELTHSCPLIDVPTPHGRLIDADNLLTDKSMSIIGKCMIFGGQYVFSESEIVNAPTIIPADDPKGE